MGGAASRSANSSSSNNSTTASHRPAGSPAATGAASKSRSSKKKRGKDGAATSTVSVAPSPSPVQVLRDSPWSNPLCFQSLWDATSESLSFPGAPPMPPPPTAACASGDSSRGCRAPNASALRTALAARRDHVNELLYQLATDSVWTQQQARSLFADYVRACRVDRDQHVLDLRTFREAFFPSWGGGTDGTLEDDSSNRSRFDAPPWPRAVIARTFRLFDADGDGLLSLGDYSQGVARLVHGRRRHRLRALFDLFDSDGDGCWSESDARGFLLAALPFVKSLTLPALERLPLRDVLRSDQEHRWWSAQLEHMLGVMDRARARGAAATAATPIAETAASAHVVPTTAAPLSARFAGPQADNGRNPGVELSSSPPPSRVFPFESFRCWAGSRLRLGAMLSRFGEALPSASRERRTIARLWAHNEQLVPGEEWFVLPQQWWDGWKRYSGFREPGEEELEEELQQQQQQQQSAQQTSADIASSPPQPVLQHHPSSGMASPLQNHALGDLFDSAAAIAGADGARSLDGDGDELLSDLLLSDTDTDSDREERDKGGAASPPAVLLQQQQGDALLFHTVSASPVRANGGGASPQLSRAQTLSIHSPTGIKLLMRSPTVSSGEAGANGSQSARTQAHSLAVAAAVPGTGSVSTLHMTPHGMAVTASAAAAASSRVPPVPHHASSSRRPSAPRPSAIDLSDLCDPRNSLLLRPNLVEHQEYVLVHSSVWAQLIEWYGVSGGGTSGAGGAGSSSGGGGGSSDALSFPRPVIEVGVGAARTKRVQLYPLCLRVVRVAPNAAAQAASTVPKTVAAAWAGVPAEGACLLFSTPGTTTVRELETRLKQLFYASAPSLAPPAAAASAAGNAAPASSTIADATASLAFDLRVHIREGNDWRCISSSAVDPSAPSPAALSPSPPSSAVNGVTGNGSDDASSPSFSPTAASSSDPTLDTLELQDDDLLLVELDPAFEVAHAAWTAANPTESATVSGKKKKQKELAVKSSPTAAAAATPSAAGGPSNGSAPPSASTSSAWPMSVRPRPRAFHLFSVGDRLDARDKHENWYRAVVRKVNPASSTATAAQAGSIVVSFEGWDEKWNEAIPVGLICACRGPCRCDGRLAPLNAQVRFKRDANSCADGLLIPAAGGPDETDEAATAPGLHPVRGLCGLANLGNTCFMASTLQCLSHTPGFVSRYFLSGKYAAEINKSNALGHKGQVALSFAKLMHELWEVRADKDHHHRVAPVQFKKVISQFAPQFDGQQQHDAHEHLAFLLDGLHEDLNRCLVKPQVAAVESNGRSDAVVVRESIEAYRKRNQSIVVDLFHGLLKSTVMCPAAGCGRVSVTFDPLRFLTLPLPTFCDRLIVVTFCPSGAGGASSKQSFVNFGVIVQDNDSVLTLKSKLASMAGIPLLGLFIADLHKSKLYRVLLDNQRVTQIRPNDVLVAFQMNPDAFRDNNHPYNQQNAQQQQQAQTGATPTAASRGIGSSSSSNGSTASAYTPTSAASSISGAPVASPSTTPSPVLRNDLCYLQAVHKYVLLNAANEATISPRFGIPVCITPHPQTTSRRIHELIAEALERWISRARESNPDMKLTYSLRLVEYTCSRCGVCPENSGCAGCVLNCDDRPSGLDGRYAVVVLWENERVARALKSAMDESPLIDHASMSSKARSAHGGAPITLAECLDQFSLVETLSSDDSWYCSSCKAHREATKQLQIFHAPEVLIIQLKRFVQVSRLRREKRTEEVLFPLRGLDLSRWIPKHALDGQQPPVYDLFAVCCHMGGLSGGHYVAFCLHADNKRWYLFDDARVQPVQPEQVQTAYAYMLMYKRRG